MYDEPNPVLIKAVVEKMKFGHFPMPIRLRVVGVTLELNITSKDCDTGAPCEVRGTHLIPPWFQHPHEFEPACMWILEKVMDMLRHEITEAMTYDGHRIFDPHKPPAKPMLKPPHEMLNDLIGKGS